MSNYISTFVERRIALATNLAEGRCGGSILDAFLILSSAMSAIASEVWPGEGIDKKRFTELLVKYSNVSPSPSMVSVPLLYHSLDNDAISKSIVKSSFLKFNHGRILTDMDVDKNENELKAVLEKLDLRSIRKYSYACLFYTEFRSGLVHEGEVSENAYPVPITQRQAAVSYSNWESSRLIVFHFPWIIEILRSIAFNLDPIFESLPLPSPKRWWTEGL